ncbi:MAG: hypothetical protein JKY37_08195 [Nannocystaceae bacterium]|nr:hypothetical protein [Nannocystaceae bacterium]
MGLVVARAHGGAAGVRRAEISEHGEDADSRTQGALEELRAWRGAHPAEQ